MVLGLDYNTIWFILIGVLLTFYMVLDGFDLGIGILYLFAKDNEEKKMHIRAIGPFWDGNEVWLVAGVGATFAAFPGAYTVILSGLYVPVMFLIFLLVFRAVSIEFCNHVHSPKLSKLWDICFGMGSLGVAFFIGVLLGNILQGFPIGPNGAMTMSIFGLINSFTLMFGILSVLLCVLHGSIFLRMKAFGSLEKRMENNFTLIWGGYFIFVLPVGVSSWQSVPNWSARILNLDYYLVLAGLFILSLILTWVYRYKMHISFTFSSLSIIFGALMLGSTHFPKIVPSSINPKYGLDIYNTASEPQTHLLMLFVALIGVPLVLVYTAIVYRVFRGKLNMQDGGYD